MTAPRIALGPADTPFTELAEKAIRNAGGEVTDVDAQADALVWLNPGDLDGLRNALAVASSARWVQLPFAGVEKVAAAGVFDPARVWTSAKGAYAEPVAEHALGLALAGLRLLPRRIVAKSWGKQGGTSLYDQPVTILGGGGITASLLELLAPLRVTATVVRNRPDPVPGAAKTVGQAGLREALADAQVVFLALALTPPTHGIIGAAELAAMRRDAWLVNVARGGVVDTDALVKALTDGAIAGAALDVTEPEPLPAGHALWRMPNVFITGHSAGRSARSQQRYAAMLLDNLVRFARGERLVNVVDFAAGY